MEDADHLSKNIAVISLFLTVEHIRQPVFVLLTIKAKEKISFISADFHCLCLIFIVYFILFLILFFVKI